MSKFHKLLCACAACQSAQVIITSAMVDAALAKGSDPWAVASVLISQAGIVAASAAGQGADSGSALRLFQEGMDWGFENGDVEAKR